MIATFFLKESSNAELQLENTYTYKEKSPHIEIVCCSTELSVQLDLSK